MKISCRRKSQLVVSYQVVTDPCCGLSVIFCGFISHLIGRETINIPEIFSGVHSFTGKTVTPTPLANISLPHSFTVTKSKIQDGGSHNQNMPAWQATPTQTMLFQESFLHVSMFSNWRILCKQGIHCPKSDTHVPPFSQNSSVILICYYLTCTWNHLHLASTNLNKFALISFLTWQQC